MRVAMLSSSVILITAALAAGAAHAAQPAAAPAARAMPAPVNAASAGVTLQGQITALNTQTRAVTVTGTDGGAVEFVAGPEVRNFNQLKVGDRVTLDYKAAVALALEPAGSAPVGVTKSGQDRAGAGSEAGRGTLQYHRDRDRGDGRQSGPKYDCAPGRERQHPAHRG